MSLLNRLSLRSLHAQLTFWFGGLLLVTMACVAIYIGQIASREIMHTAGETLAISTRASAELLTTNLAEREREIELLRQAIEANPDMTDQRIRTMLERIQSLKSGYAWIGLTDSKDMIRTATHDMLVGQDVSTRPWFQGAQEGLFIGDLHLAVLLAKLFPAGDYDQPLRFIDIAVPVRDRNGQPAGVLAAHLHWSWVTSTVKMVLTQDHLLNDAELLIVDRQGTILYPEALVASLKLPKDLNQDTAYSVLDWGDEQRYLTSVAAVGSATSIDLGWRVIMRQPIETTTQSITNLQQRLALLGMLAFMVFVMIAYRIAGRLSKPIESLVKTAQQIESNPGQASFPKPSSSPELTALSNALESMTRSLLHREQELASLNASLEQQVALRTQELSQANDQLQQLAQTDPLTGLLNRRSFEQNLQEHDRRARLSSRPYSILMLDADHFKNVNDHFGHQIGDQVLQQLGQLIRQATRITDICARYGGEEFIVLVPELARDSQSEDLGEKIRTLVEQSTFPGIGQMTISVGISESWATDDGPHVVIARADAALYQAKARGRNRVIWAPQQRPA